MVVCTIGTLYAWALTMLFIIRHEILSDSALSRVVSVKQCCEHPLLSKKRGGYTYLCQILYAFLRQR